MNYDNLKKEFERLGVEYLEKGDRVMCKLNPIGYNRNGYPDEYYPATIVGFANNPFYNDKAIKVKYIDEKIDKEFGECYVYIEHIASIERKL